METTNSESQRFEQYWTTKQVAARLHVTADAVKKWLGTGKLERTKAGGATLISESALQRFLIASTKAARQVA